MWTTSRHTNHLCLRKQQRPQRTLLPGLPWHLRRRRVRTVWIGRHNLLSTIQVHLHTTLSIARIHHNTTLTHQSRRRDLRIPIPDLLCTCNLGRRRRRAATPSTPAIILLPRHNSHQATSSRPSIHPAPWDHRAFHMATSLIRRVTLSQRHRQTRMPVLCINLHCPTLLRHQQTLPGKPRVQGMAARSAHMAIL